MNERRNVPEIVIVICELLRRSQTRINLLFTMSEITHTYPAKDTTCEVMFRGRYLNGKPLEQQTSSIFNSIWWSQTGSNRRPHACKARALPAELWPRTRRRMLYVQVSTRSFCQPVFALWASPGTLRNFFAWLRHAKPKAKRGGPGKT